MSRALFSPFASKSLFAPAWPVRATLAAQASARVAAEYHGGRGRIVGTVKRADTPANTPLRRRVLLLRERDALVIAEAWSDVTTGNYVFEHIDAAQRYTVLATDYEHHYRAVIADNITPEAM